MGKILDKLRFWKKKKKKEDDSDVLFYRLKGKPPEGRWKKMTDVDKGDFDKIDTPEKAEDPQPGWSYKLVEIVSEDGEEGRTVWSLKSDVSKGEIREMIKQEGLRQRQQGGGSDPVEAMHEGMKELEQEMEKMQSIANTASKLAGMFGTGRQDDKERAPRIPQPEYEGKLPVWMHPQVQNSIQDFIEETADNVSKKVSKNMYSDGNKDEIDQKFDRMLPEEEDEESQGEVERNRLSEKEVMSKRKSMKAERKSRGSEEMDEETKKRLNDLLED